MVHKFRNKSFSIWSKESLWIPGDDRPSANRRPMKKQWHTADTAMQKRRGRGNNGDSIAGLS